MAHSHFHGPAFHGHPDRGRAGGAEASLLDRHVQFVAALREAGLPVSVAESLDAIAAFGQIDVLDREAFREAYAATLVKRQIQRAVFDRLFDIWYPAGVGEEIHSWRSDGIWVPAEPSREAPRRWIKDDPVRQRLREELSSYLLTGDERLGRSVARDAVNAFRPREAGGRGPRTWSRSEVMSHLEPYTLWENLLRELLQGRTDETAEALVRSLLDRRLEDFTQFVEADVRRHMAERDGVENASRATTKSVDQIALASATAAEMKQIRREIAPLARRLGARLAQKQRAGSRGVLDMRRTIRDALATGGVPLVVRTKPKRPTRMDLVILCDVSQSVTSFAHFTLLLVYALREQFTRVRTFAFVDEVDEVTRYFTPGGDPAEAVRAMSQNARVTGLSGRTDYGRAIENLQRRWGDAIGSRTCLLILGDARTNYTSTALPTLSGMVDRAHRAYWLNPEQRRMWDIGDSVASRYAAVVPMVECRNLAQLSEFVEQLGEAG